MGRLFLPHRSQKVGAMAAARWCFQSAFNSPRATLATQQPPGEQFLIRARHTHKISKRQTLASILEHDVRDPVVGLLALGRPTTIAGRVVASVVLPVKGVIARWTFSHISKEILKRAPSSTDCDTAFLVVLERWIGRLRAASDHVLPAAIGGAAPSRGWSGVSMNETLRHLFDLCLVKGASLHG